MTEEKAVHKNTINWFPGHMKRTEKLIGDNLKLCDIVCEIRDARIPLASRNPDIERLTGGKPKIIVFGKSDLADSAASRKWIKYFRLKGINCMLFDVKSKVPAQEFAALCRESGADILKKREEKGISRKTLRVMVVGIPNVGKSTFINSMAGRKAADAQDRPGVTKGKQWVSVKGASDLEFLDTPGVLWPKIETDEQGLMLSYVGSIKDEILETEYIAMNLLKLLNTEYREVLLSRYPMKDTENMEPYELLEELARARGFLRKGGEKDTERASKILLDEFRAGLVGKITLEDTPVE